MSAASHAASSGNAVVAGIAAVSAAVRLTGARQLAASAPSIHPTPASRWAPQHGALPPVTVKVGGPRAAQSHLWLKFYFNFGSGPSKLQFRLAAFTVFQMVSVAK